MFDGGGGDRVADDRGRVAPYAPWPTVRAVLRRLRAAGALPDVLHRKDLDGLFASTVLKQTLAAFRFMGLIDEAHRPTQRMRDLVAAHSTPGWSSALADVLRRSFPEIVGLDLVRATREQLDAEFRAYGDLSEPVRKKCVRFFLAAAREAGIPLSAELAGPPRDGADADMVPRPDAARVHPPHEDGARELFPNPPLDPPSPTVVALLQKQSAEAASGAVPQRSADLYRTAYAALKATWDPGELPEEVDAAVLTVLRLLRTKEAEATKA